MLLFMNLSTIFVLTNISSKEMVNLFLQEEDNSSLTSLNQAPQSKIGSEITSGRTTLTTDKDSYTPGEWVEVVAKSNTDEMNGSLEWQLESPISEVAFDFHSEFLDIFEDPSFNNPVIPDWINESFYAVEATSGYLNLTEVRDDDINDAEAYYNTSYSLESNSRYKISFDYFSASQNLLQNPGFEGGNTDGWVFNSSYVIPVEDPDNASAGNYYVNINGTEGFLLNQTVDFVGGGREIVLVVKATGNTDNNFWDLRLEAYNSTGHRVGSKVSSDSRGITPDDKGYITLIMTWVTPDNTTQLRFSFRGRSTEGDIFYTGWLDDCYLYEVPPSLIFSYWSKEGDNLRWTNETLVTEPHKWENASFEVDMWVNNSKTFRFILPDINSFSNNATTYWLIDNIAVNNVTVSTKVMGPITNIKDNFSGHINATWFHRGFREDLSSSYDIEVETPENATTPSECQATIRVQLPSHQVYFGSWIFVFQIHQIDDDGIYLDTKAINISFIVQEPMNYVVQDLYMLRGSTNKTINENDSILIEYFAQETNIQAISPGDNVTVLGFLEANSTNSEWYSLDFLQIGSASVEYLWNSPWKSHENISWSEFGFISYDKEGESILDGNFSSPLNNVSTLGFNFRIPNRGIIGNLSANLTIKLIGTNLKENGVGGASLDIIIPLNLPPVKFKINIIEENLPKDSYYITDYLGGNLTLLFLNFNDSLEIAFPNRTISSNISIPMKDLELTIFLDNLNQTPLETDISQEFHYHYIGKTVLWLDSVDPSLMAGTYAFRIRWNAAYKLGIQDQEELISAHFIKIKGSPVVIPAEDYVEIQQGGQKTINFSVRLENATGKRIRGLALFGNVIGNESPGNIVVYEDKGVYKIDLDIELDAVVNTYTIEIFIVSRADFIGELSYQVIERPIDSEDEPSFIDLVIGIGGFLFFIIAAIGVVGVMFWANKFLK